MAGPAARARVRPAGTATAGAPTGARRRNRIERSQKSLLIELAGDPPRCWICGTPFDPVARDAFIHGEAASPPAPAFVDVLRPRGLAAPDGCVQVDHVVPVAMGGADGDNLALACGWCNRHKGARTSIYDVEGTPRPAGPNALGIASLPRTFWIVRQLAVVPWCEHVGGCDRDATNAALTIAPANPRGALNPGNLVTTCYEHDPLRVVRLQAPDIVRSLWAA